MRARLALVAAGIPVALREVVLREKPAAFLEVSDSGTVPCLVTSQGAIDESLEIMVWALRQNDPQGWLDMPSEGWQWIERCDGPFKHSLDRTKYATRYPSSNTALERIRACAFLDDLDRQIDGWIFGRPTLADFAILPFVRQFAFIDKTWFDARDWTKLHQWLDRFLASPEFHAIMPKYPQWFPDMPEKWFPQDGSGDTKAPEKRSP